MYCLIACGFVVLLEPCAAGSGIPEIKCVLNGVRLPRATIFKTLVGKVSEMSHCGLRSVLRCYVVRLVELCFLSGDHYQWARKDL